MARKGSGHRNSADQPEKHKFSDPVDIFSPDATNNNLQGTGENIADRKGMTNANLHVRYDIPDGKSGKKSKGSGNGKKQNHGPGKVSAKNGMEEISPNMGRSDSLSSKTKEGIHFTANEHREDEITTSSVSKKSNRPPNGLMDGTYLDGPRSSMQMVMNFLRTMVMRFLNAATTWFERQRPRINAFSALFFDAHNYVRIKINHAYPIIRMWVLHVGKILFLLSMVWMDFSIRGFNSLLHMGTTSFFTVIWCSFLSILAMVGVIKMLMLLVCAGMVTVFIGLGLAILIFAITSIIFLFMYGSFWTTGLIITFAGMAFALSHERIALFVATAYSIYCAKYYVGWLGLFVGLNISFVSSDILMDFIRNNPRDQESVPHDRFTQSRSRANDFYSDHAKSSPSDASYPGESRAEERNAGVPSTSGSETELASEDEVARLLNCSDHYSALGFARYENIDVSLLKREYRKKAMLVHPDKNMGNERAAEAFKKLQNAYEVLLDSLKRKTYDDELRREEILNYFRRFRSIPQKGHQNGKRGNFSPGFSHSEGDFEGPHGDSRRIACKQCGDFHIWILTDRSKSQARWCQECKDFHQTKDGDGWVEQSFQPLLFGMLHKMNPPRAYVCAGSKIYDATQWFVCQGMRCPVNSHKPSFHVNTSVSSKHSSKGTASSSGSGGIPKPNVDEAMTEEEFFEWLQNAVQSGMFETNGCPGEGASPKGSGNPKSSGGGSSSKKKRKGKKW